MTTATTAAMTLTADRAKVYAVATSTFVAQFVVYVVEEQWEWLLAALVAWSVWQLMLIPELPQLMSLVFNQDGLHATGQRVFGVLSAYKW